MGFGKARLVRVKEVVVIDKGKNVVEDEAIVDLTEGIGQGNGRVRRGKNVVEDEALEDLSY